MRAHAAAARLRAKACVPAGFRYLFADGDIMVARGARGGIALLARATPAWLLEHGAA